MNFWDLGAGYRIEASFDLCFQTFRPAGLPVVLAANGGFFTRGDKYPAA